MDIIAKTGKRFIIHPHDQSLMDYIEGRAVQARGDNTPKGYAQERTQHATASSGTPQSR